MKAHVNFEIEFEFEIDNDLSVEQYKNFIDGLSTGPLLAYLAMMADAEVAWWYEENNCSSGVRAD